MPQDPLQIAFEHHRAGRLAQAEQRYRQLLADDPENADALHWLGTLRVQQGSLAEALELLERAAALRPDDAAFMNNLAQALVQIGRFDDAVRAFQRSIAIEPQHVQSLTGLAFALSNRLQPGDADAAVDVLRKAASMDEPTPELEDSLGVALIVAGRVDEAISVLGGVLAKHGSYAPSYLHIALAHRVRGESRNARKCLLKSLEIDPSSARGWYELGMLDIDAGRPAVAAGPFRKAIAADRHFVPAHAALARALEAIGQTEQAAQVRAASQHVDDTPDTPADAESLNASDFHYALACRLAIFTPDQIPARGVSKLFDDYAERFDKHLRDKLQYRVPELIHETFRKWIGEGSFAAAGKPDMLDLGCGTGQCGFLLRPDVRTLAGVDLAPAMIEKARARGVYDQLDVGELVARMQASPAAFDLLVAADVMIYVGDLAPVFEAAATCLRPGGRLVFSAESCAGERYQLGMRTRRFLHSDAYIRRITAIFGFDLVALDPIVIRQERLQPVQGVLVTVARPQCG